MCLEEWFGDTDNISISISTHITLMAKMPEARLGRNSSQSLRAGGPHVRNYSQVLLIGSEVEVFTQIINNYLTMFQIPLIK